MGCLLVVWDWVRSVALDHRSPDGGERLFVWPKGLQYFFEFESFCFVCLAGNHAGFPWLCNGGIRSNLNAIHMNMSRICNCF